MSELTKSTKLKKIIGSELYTIYPTTSIMEVIGLFENFLAATNGKKIDTNGTGEDSVVFKGNNGQISMLDNEIQGDSYSILTNFDEIHSSNFYGDLYNANNVESQKVNTSEVNIGSSIKLVYDSNSESLNFIFT